MENSPNTLWLELVSSDMTSIVAYFDDEMIRLIGLAAYIGDASGDQTPVSYSSLMIALLWSDDPTSKWFQDYAIRQKIATNTLYKHRGIKESDQKQIIENSQRNESFRAMGKDFMSSSARTMLSNAQSVANDINKEVGIGVRHLLATYAFLNPTYHEQDFTSWKIDVENLRSEFALFITHQYQEEEQDWYSRLRGYVTTSNEEIGDDFDPGIILVNYPFEDDAIELLRMVETLAIQRSFPVLNTELLLKILLFSAVESKSLVEQFRNVLTTQALEPSNLSTLLGDDSFEISYEKKSFIDTEGTALGISAGLKRTLDRARTFTFTTNPKKELGSRHIIAALIVHQDTYASEQLSNASVNFSILRRGLLHSITRSWLGDDGVEWNKILIGITPPTLTPYKSDDPDKGDDCLDVSRYASAFATVIAAESNKPPMSIGIFGDWGSGKSFFMRLMREKAKIITQQTDTDENNKRVFCENIVAIEFNAWHYAETNLWASLVHTILTKLGEAINEDKKSVKQLEQLELACTAREEAERRISEISAKEDAAKIHCSTIKKRLSDSKKKHEALLSPTDVLNAVAREVMADKDVDDILTIAEDRLGLKGAKTMKRNVGELKKLMDTAQEQYSEMKSTWDWIKQPHIYKTLRTTAAVVALLAGLVIYFFYHGKASIEWINIIFVETSAIVSAVLIHSYPLINGIKQGMSRLGNLRSRIDVVEQGKLQKRQRELETAARELSEIGIELARADEKLALAQVEVQHIEDEISGISSINQIAGMIERRLAGQDYEKYLSIVSMIRRDFEKLSDYFANSQVDVDADTGLKQIDRIVLYIDDLDRCPSDQVVKVLEAVHLMLAFKLFVVVVGVDMRWASISLHEHYPAHLSSLDIGGENKEDNTSIQISHTASAMDYLEKIFQIPFWLPPMEEKASRDMLATLVPVRTSKEDELIQEDENDREQEEQEENNIDSSSDKDSGQDEEKEMHISEDLSAAESLEIDTGEREYMLGLAGAVGRSPRRLKRFVNTYRILKSSCDPLEREGFVNDNGQSGTYRAVMTLLAITTGAPSAALKILLTLNEKDDTCSLQEFRNDIEEMSADFVNGEIHYVFQALDVYADNGEPKPVDIKVLKEWVSRAAHFSFRSGRI